MSFIEVPDKPHLGGYIQGGDEATYYPVLWDFLVKEMESHNILDVGCGDGVAVDYFNSIGANAWGVDGVWQPHERIVEHDYYRGCLDVFPGLDYSSSQSYDLIWCCEFVEHIEEQHLYAVLDTFKRSRTVAMTHAEPGQQGFHHVNLQYARYWVTKLAEIGFTLDSATTIRTRTLAADNQSPYNHYVRSGMFFRRDE